MKWEILAFVILGLMYIGFVHAQEAPNVNEVIAKSNVEAGQLRLALGQMQEQTLAALKDADQTQDELQDELEK